MSFLSPKKSFKRVLWVLWVSVLSSAVFAGAAGAAEFPAFSSQSSTGESVSEAVFADAKLTMINIWATWCPPCLDEMPDLGRLGRSMPEGSRLVGIILDSDAMEDAKKILTEAKADFLQIIPVKEMAPVLDEIDAIPTTIFVDSRGQLVGPVLVGSRAEGDYRAEIEKILKSMP
jgi:thiol-disulfide isomerase/thioredoxin